MNMTSEARDLGKAYGRGAGSWVIDGNTTVAAAARILKGYDDGDPEIMDLCPSAWGNGMTPFTLAESMDLRAKPLSAAWEEMRQEFGIRGRVLRSLLG